MLRTVTILHTGGYQWQPARDISTLHARSSVHRVGCQDREREEHGQDKDPGLDPIAERVHQEGAYTCIVCNVGYIILSSRESTLQLLHNIQQWLRYHSLPLEQHRLERLPRKRRHAGIRLDNALHMA
jgi:hypothetical protein